MNRDAMKTIRIRQATPDDAATIREIYGQYIEATSITFHTEVPSLSEVRTEIEQCLKLYPMYVAELEGKVIGYANASEHHPRPAYRWSINVSIYLDKNYLGQGIGRALYQQLFATVKRQGFRMVHAGITLPNEPSQRIHESFGFKHIGTFPAAGYKLNVWKDVGWWVLDLMDGMELSTDIAEPIPFSEMG